MHYELCIEKRPQGVTVWRRRHAVASSVRSATHAGECNDGVPPLGLVTLCIIRPFPCCSVRRRTAVSHAVNGGDAVVTISPLQCPTANRRLTCRQRRGRRRYRSTAGRRRYFAGRRAAHPTPQAGCRRYFAGRRLQRRDAGRHTLVRRSNENRRSLPRPRRPCCTNVFALPRPRRPCCTEVFVLPRPRRPCYPEVLQLFCHQMVNVMAR